MSATIYTASKRELMQNLVAAAGEKLKHGSRELIVLVPNQLTLETEIELLNALQLKGSFRLNVVSPNRLCGMIFEECGKPTGTIIDERGRAMLMSYLLKQNEKQLKWYSSTASSSGFELKLVEEISRLRQAEISAEQIELLSEKLTDERMSAKLKDLSLLYRQYEAKIGLSIQDGEQASEEACARMSASWHIAASDALVFGFDITTRAINKLIAGLCAVCGDVKIFMPLPDEQDGGDMIYEPLKKAIARLCKLLEEKHISYETYRLPPQAEVSSMQAALKKIYSLNNEKITLEHNEIGARQLKNPLDEARFVASNIRKLVRTQNLSYADICVVIDNPESYENVIEFAFNEFEVPYFSQQTLNALSHPLCRFLDETLKLIAGRSEGINALCETGFTCLDASEQELLDEYISRLKLRPSALFKPFTRGTSDMISVSEPIREKLMQPIIELRQSVRSAKTLSDQLRLLYSYMSDTGCFEKYSQMIQSLREMGLNGAAQDAIRISNLMHDSFDQLNELVGPKPLSAQHLGDLIRRALETAVIKVLPQSPDAVQVCSAQRMGMKPFKHIFLMHAVSGGAMSQKGIFDDEELDALSDVTQTYIAPSLTDLVRTERMYTKDALLMATESVSVSYPSGGMDGSALSKSSLVSELSRAVEGFKVLGGVNDDAETINLRLTSPKAALNCVTGELPMNDMNALFAQAIKLMEGDGSLNRIKRAATYSNLSQQLDKDVAKALYRGDKSVSRLEKYASCPFAHFIQYGLKPLSVRDFKIDPLNRGTLLHQCVELFLRDANIEGASEDEAVTRMGEIFDDALEGEIAPYARDTHAAAFELSTLKRAALRAATLLYRQLKKGVFKPVELEVSFGSEGRKYLKLREGLSMNGRIDRIDAGEHEGQKHVFVVDYKTGNNKPAPNKIFEGLQLQLLLYLAVACERHSAQSAGVYYFHISDEPVKDESTDSTIIEAARTKQLRMSGIAPDSEALLKQISDEPQNVINVDFKKDGQLKSGFHASPDEFRLLMNHTLKRCREFSDEILNGDTTVSPITGTGTDSCKYCDYAAVCLKDKQLKGTKKRKLKRLKYRDLIEKIRES